MSSLLSVSAFYAECHEKRICFNSYIWTKSKFLGLSIGVNMVGQGDYCKCYFKLKGPKNMPYVFSFFLNIIYPLFLDMIYSHISKVNVLIRGNHEKGLPR